MRSEPNTNSTILCDIPYGTHILKADVSKIQYIASGLNMDGSVDAFDMVSLRQKAYSTGEYKVNLPD